MSDQEEGTSQGTVSGSKSNTNANKKAKSCLECRRLKCEYSSIMLKCSRTWPCTNCRRRGVQNLCPDGVLEYSTTEQHQKTCRRLLDRIVELERIVDLISGEEGTGAASGKPLKVEGLDLGKGKGKLRLAPNLVSLLERSESGDQSSTRSSHSAPSPTPPKDDEEDDSLGREYRYNDEIGVLNVSEGKLDNMYSYIGHSGAPLLLSAHEPLSASALKKSKTLLPADFILPPLAFSAPVTSLDEIVSRFPSSTVANELAHSYFTNVACYYPILDRHNIQKDLSILYGQHNVQEGEDPTTLVEGAKKLHPHRLAVLCMVFTLANTFSSNPSVIDPTTFYRFAQIFLTRSTSHFLVATTLSTCETLLLMTIFLFDTGTTESMNSAWPLLGLCLRLAQAMGLHKDSRKWRGAVGEDVWKDRARVWWECVTYDRLQSLNFGRPYLCSNSQMDCNPPPLQSDNPHLPSINTFHRFKYELTKFFADISDALCNGAGYNHICAIDQKIRSIERTAPDYLQLHEGTFDSINRLESMGIVREEARTLVAQQHMLSLLIHNALLFLHRPWFAKALQAGVDPMTSPYVSSFVACITSARKYSKTDSILHQIPEISRWWFYPFHAFTSAAIQALVMIRCPASCILVNEVWTDFNFTFNLFIRMKRTVENYNRMIDRALPSIENLKRKVTESLEKKRFQQQHNPNPNEMIAFGTRNSPGNVLVTDLSSSAMVNSLNNDHDNNMNWQSEILTSTDLFMSTSPSSTTTMNPYLLSSTVALPADVWSSIGGVDPATLLSEQGLPQSLSKPSEWTTEMDPLMQNLVFWHPDGAIQSLPRSPDDLSFTPSPDTSSSIFANMYGKDY